MGFIRVPKDAIHFKPHSNEILRYDKIVTQKIQFWTQYKAAMGWLRISNPTIFAPVPSPTENPDADPEDGDDLRVYVKAQFVRAVPLYGSNDDLHELRESAKRYGVDPDGPLKAENDLPEPVPNLIADANRKPMVEAQKRRDELGLRRKLILTKDEYGDTIAAGATVEPV